MNAGNGMRDWTLVVLDRLQERFETMTPLSPERCFTGRWAK